MMRNTDVARKFCSKAHLKDVIGAVNFCRDQQMVANRDFAAVYHRRAKYGVADQKVHHGIPSRYHERDEDKGADVEIGKGATPSLIFFEIRVESFVDAWEDPSF